MARSGAIPIEADLNVGKINIDPNARRELDAISKKLDNLARRHGLGSVATMVQSAQGAGYSDAMSITYARRMLERVTGKKLDLPQLAGMQYAATKVFAEQKRRERSESQKISDEKKRAKEESKAIKDEAGYNFDLQFGSVTKLRERIAKNNILKSVLMKHGTDPESDQIKGLDEQNKAMQEIVDALGEEADETKKSIAAMSMLAASMKFVGKMLDGMWDNGTPITNLYEKARGSLPMMGSAIGTAFGPLGTMIGGAIGSLGAGIIDAIHGAWRQTTSRAVRMRNRWGVLGGRWNANFAENLGAYGINEGSVAGAVNHARYFKTNAAYGMVSEDQFMGHAILGNYHAAVMRGAGAIELMEALRKDYAQLGPEHYHVGLQKLGLSEDLMNINTLTPEDWKKITDPQAVRDQEIIDISNNVKTIADWAQRNLNELNAVRSAANATYAGTNVPGSIIAASKDFEKDGRKTWEDLSSGDPARVKRAINVDWASMTGKNVVVTNNNTVQIDGEEVRKTTQVTKGLLSVTQNMVM